MIAEIAKQAVLDANVLPAKNILFHEIVYADWDGQPKVQILLDETEPEDVTQFGILSYRSTLRINGLAVKSADAVKNGKNAAEAVAKRFAEMERRSNCGHAEPVFTATKTQEKTQTIDNNRATVHTTVFDVLHR